MAGKGYMAGVKLGLNCLERSAKNLIALIRFIELNEFNASKKRQIDREDIPAKMGFVCKDTLSWLIQIGEEKSSKAVKKPDMVHRKVSRCMSWRPGNTEAARLRQDALCQHQANREQTKLHVLTGGL